jgi:hypothetical protein
MSSPTRSGTTDPTIWQGRYADRIDEGRRRVLRGAGGVALALPFLPPLGRRAFAAPGKPQRFVSFFFGNGMPPTYSAPGFEGPVLKALAPFAPKMSLIRGINNRAAPGGSGHPHAKGSSTFAIGYSNPSVETAGGKSLDMAAYDAWKPPTGLTSLAASLWWWSEDIVRNTHSWQGPGRPNPGITRPLALFNRLFGEAGPVAPVGSPEAAKMLKQRRYSRSVLDSVIDGYKSITSEASGYSPQVRSTLSNHFEAVRSLERRAIALDMAANGGGPACAGVKAPPDISPQQTCSRGCDTKGSTGSHMAGGGSNKSSNWDEVWPLLADLFVMGLRCDVARVGNLTCTAAGDRYNFAGQAANVHDLAHSWRPGGENGFDQSVTWCMGRLAYFLKAMDDPAYMLPEGGTLLDNTPILIGTEVADPAPHSFANLTFMLAGGGGKVFKPGVYDFGNKSSEVDLYSTLSRALGIGDKFGDPRYFTDYLPGLV